MQVIHSMIFLLIFTFYVSGMQENAFSNILSTSSSKTAIVRKRRTRSHSDSSLVKKRKKKKAKAKKVLLPRKTFKAICEDDKKLIRCLPKYPKIQLNEPAYNLKDTLLHMAVLYDKELTPLLHLCSKDNVNKLNSTGNSPLYLATKLGSKEKSCILLQHGATANIRNQNGNTPLHEAAKIGSVELIKLLCNFQADPNLANEDGETPLHIYTVYNQDTIGLQCLLEREARLNVANKYGETPLHYAAASHHAQSIKWLIKKGCTQNICNNEGKTAFYYAQQTNCVDTINAFNL